MRRRPCVCHHRPCSTCRWRGMLRERTATQSRADMTTTTTHTRGCDSVRDRQKEERERASACRLPGAAYTTSCARAAGCWTLHVAPPSIMGRRQERSRGREIRVAVEDEDEDHSHNIPHQKQRQSRRRRSERTKDNEDDGYDMRPDSLFSSGPFVVLRLFVTALLTVVLVASALLAWRRRRSAAQMKH